MYISRLTLTNVRCFESLVVDFARPATVLLGENGLGKSLVCDAIAAAFSGLDRASTPPLTAADRRIMTVNSGAIFTREQAASAHVRLDVELNGKRTLLEGSMDALTEGFTTSVASDRMIARVLGRVQKVTQLALPLFGYYRAGRRWRTAPTAALSAGGSRLAGYASCLDAGADLAGLRAIWRDLDHRRLDLGIQSPELAGVEQALGHADFGGSFFQPSYDTATRDILIDVPGRGRLSLAQLSDGYRNLICMTADLALRAATLNPHLGAEAPLLTTGVVVIDELDLHLHPTWQRKALPGLLSAFPALQFIVTTHSPQVLGSAENEWTRRLRQDGTIDEGLHVQNRDSNEILHEVMPGAGRRSPAGEETIRMVRRALQSGELERARSGIATLEALWGANDHTVAQLRVALSFEE